MKRSALAAACALLSGSVIVASPPAQAADVYQLQVGLYAIICEDGHIFSYEGSEGGLSTVVPALCEGHGGVVGSGDGVITTPGRASAELERLMQRCTREGRAVSGLREATSCPGRISARARESAPARSAQ